MTWSRVACVLCGILVWTWCGGLAAAQEAHDSIAAWGVIDAAPHTFARYATPQECVRAEAWSEFQFWRDRRADTVSHARAGNPDQPGTVDSVRSCVARFTVAATPVGELLGLGRAYLLAEEPARADSAFGRLVVSMGNVSPESKAWTMYLIVASYLDAPRPDLVAAERMLGQLDAMGPSAGVGRMLGHLAMADEGHRRDSVALQVRALALARRAADDLQGDTRREYASSLAEVYQREADLEVRHGRAASALAILDTAQRELDVIRPSVGKAVHAARGWYTPIGTPAPAIRGARWFSVAGVSGAGDRRPAAGKPTLVVFAYHGCADDCYPGYAVLRRLGAKYGARLDIILVTRTLGYYRNQLATPDSEMAHIGRYFLDVLHLPVTTAVWSTDFGTRDDRKKIVLSAPNEEAYRSMGGRLPVFLVDTEGKIRMLSNATVDNEAVLDDMIASLL